jgi:hypothetical protein
MDTLPRPLTPFNDFLPPFEEDEDGKIPAHEDPEVDDVELWEQLQTQYRIPRSPELSPPETNQLGNLERLEATTTSPPPTPSPQFACISTEIPALPDTAPNEPGGVIPSKLASGDILTLQNGIAPTNAIWSNQDLSLLRIYKACDDAGAPRYLPDKLLSLLSDEIGQNAFDPTHPSITQRDTFMARMHHKFPTTPPTRINVALEDGTTVPIYRFDFLSSLRHHLLREDFCMGTYTI